jgi:hypothetical protein
MHLYEVRPRKDHRGVDLISDVLPFGRLWYLDAAAAVGYAKLYSRSHSVIIRVFRSCRRRDRDARAEGRFQRVVACYVADRRRA